jgi:hypothetical protein
MNLKQITFLQIIALATGLLIVGCETEQDSYQVHTPLGPDGAAPADLVMGAEGILNPGSAINGVFGNGLLGGSYDVASLGYNTGVDDFVMLSWSNRVIQDGPGADVVIFENPFFLGDGSLRFMDQLVVAFSHDGLNWVVFPHDYLASDETDYVADPGIWIGFAGIEPVLLNERNNRVDPFVQQSAGGDPFDLSDLPASDPVTQEIWEQGCRYVRLTTAATLVNPDTGELFVRDSASNGADIDGVYARYLEDDME